MPDLGWNAFLNKHAQCVRIQFAFAGYAQMKKMVAKAHRKGQRVVNRGHKRVPTPNQIIRKLAADNLKGDFAVGSERPDLQSLLLADPNEAKAIATGFQAQLRPGREPPFLARYEVFISEERFIPLARKYDLY
jgi:hypothetical protein